MTDEQANRAIRLNPDYQTATAAKLPSLSPREPGVYTRRGKPLSGPCIVVEHKREGWMVRFGSYKDDAQAERLAKKSNKDRTDGAKAHAGRWEDAK